MFTVRWLAARVCVDVVADKDLIGVEGGGGEGGACLLLAGLYRRGAKSC